VDTVGAYRRGERVCVDVGGSGDCCNALCCTRACGAVGSRCQHRHTTSFTTSFTTAATLCAVHVHATLVEAAVNIHRHALSDVCRRMLSYADVC
jgi:hypothetical protein